MTTYGLAKEATALHARQLADPYCQHAATGCPWLELLRHTAFAVRQCPANDWLMYAATLLLYVGLKVPRSGLHQQGRSSKGPEVSGLYNSYEEQAARP